VVVRSRQQTFNPGELPLVLLALAESGPTKAYDFISELDRLFGSRYRASPGGVYPALTALLDERLLMADRTGRAKKYSLTDRGRSALEQRRRELAALEERTGVRFTEADSLVPHVEQFATRVLKLSGKVNVDAALCVLARAAEEIERLEEGDGRDDRPL